MNMLRLLVLTFIPLLAVVCGCRTPAPPTEFSEVPDYMMADTGVEGQARPAEALVDLQILGARAGAERSALVKGTRNALGPASAAFPEPEKLRYAEKLADRVLAGDKVTLHLPRDLATAMARQLQEAGLVTRVSE